MLGIFAILLSICVYPIFLRIPVEIAPVYGTVDSDLFCWYRLWLIVVFALISFFSKGHISKTACAFLFLVFISVSLSPFFRTGVFGAPFMYEGLLAYFAYACIYKAAKNQGLTKWLETSLDAVIIIMFIAGVLQLICGSFIYSPIGWIFPKGEYQIIKWPMYATLGHANNLGLFCALFFPYAILRKKYILTALILFMALCTSTRASWFAMGIAVPFIDKKAKIGLAIALILSAPLYKDRVIEAIGQVHYPIQDRDFGSRGYLWKETVPQLKTSLITGHGPGTFALYFPQYQRRGDAVGFFKLLAGKPHNMYINIWVGGGLLSLLLLLLMLGRIIIPAKDLSIKLGSIAFLINGLFTDSVLSVTPYFIIFLGVLSADNEKRGYGKRTRRVSETSWLSSFPHLATNSHRP